MSANEEDRHQSPRSVIPKIQVSPILQQLHECMEMFNEDLKSLSEKKFDEIVAAKLEAGESIREQFMAISEEADNAARKEMQFDGMQQVQEAIDAFEKAETLGRATFEMYQNSKRARTA